MQFFLKNFNNLYNLILEDFSNNFDERYCYILGKHQIFQPDENNLQCIYIDKYLDLKVKKRTLNGDIDISLNKIELKINKFVVERINDKHDNELIKNYSSDKSKIESNFGIPFICECDKTKLKIKILIKYDIKYKRFYAFAKTCWYNLKNHTVSKFHPNELIRTLINEHIK